MELLRRMRGALGNALAWGLAWTPAGALWAASPWGPGVSAIVGVMVEFGAMGFVAGGAFSVVLGLVENRRRLHELSLPRFAMWGAAGGLTMGLLVNTVGVFIQNVLGTPAPILSLGNLAVGGVLAVLSAGSAAGSLVIARRVSDPALPGVEGDRARIESGQ